MLVGDIGAFGRILGTSPFKPEICVVSVLRRETFTASFRLLREAISAGVLDRRLCKELSAMSGLI